MIRKTLNTITPLQYFNKFKHFDKVTEFRLLNAFIVAIGIALIVPITISLKGMYLAAWAISLFAIAQTLVVKTNKWVVSHFTIEQMYRMSIFVHLGFILISGIYFISPFIMIVFDSFLGIIEVLLFSAFSISLNTYLTDEYPEHMNEFQITRNGIWADGYLIGLATISIVTYFFSLSTGVLVFIGFNLLFSAWLLLNWNFYKGNEYCTTLHHK